MTSCDALDREIGAGTESPPDAGEHDHADIGIVIAGPHVFADLGDGAVFLRGSDERVHPLRAIELDPEDAAVLRLIEQVFDKPRSHVFLPARYANDSVIAE